MRRRILGEWVLVGRQGMSLDDYMRLSLHDRWHLHEAVQQYMEALYGGSLTPPGE